MNPSSTVLYLADNRRTQPKFPCQVGSPLASIGALVDFHSLLARYFGVTISSSATTPSSPPHIFSVVRIRQVFKIIKGVIQSIPVNMVDSRPLLRFANKSRSQQSMHVANLSFVCVPEVNHPISIFPDHSGFLALRVNAPDYPVFGYLIRGMRSYFSKFSHANFLAVVRSYCNGPAYERFDYHAKIARAMA